MITSLRVGFWSSLILFSSELVQPNALLHVTTVRLSCRYFCIRGKCSDDGTGILYQFATILHLMLIDGS
jgi:hypothetical protein